MTDQRGSDDLAKTTLNSGFNSGNLPVDRANEPGLYRFAMPNPETAAREYAEVMSVIERVREERSRLDTTIATLEGLAERLRLATAGAGSQVVPAPPATQSAGDDATSAVAAGKDADSTLASGRYRVISQTTMIADEDGQAIRSEPASGSAPKDQGSREAQVKIARHTAIDATPSSLRVVGLRDGSKKHRIYVATVTLLKNGSMYIDDILERLPTALFDGITGDKRNNLSNILSQLKTVGLLVSDNRGNWSLPNRTAAE